MDYTTLGSIAALVTAVIGGVCGIVGLVQSWRRGRAEDASQLLKDHRDLVDEYRQAHAADTHRIDDLEKGRARDRDRLDALEAEVDSLHREHAKCQERLKAAEEKLGLDPTSGPTTGG